MKAHRIPIAAALCAVILAAPSALARDASQRISQPLDGHRTGAVGSSWTSDASGRFAQRDRTVRATDVVSRGPSERRANDVLELQRALAARGFDPGAIDGVMGPQTREALLGYQRHNELSQTGRLDRETLAALGWPRTAARGDDRPVGTDTSAPGSARHYAGAVRYPAAAAESASSAGGSLDSQEGSGGL